MNESATNGSGGGTDGRRLAGLGLALALVPFVAAFLAAGVRDHLLWGLGRGPLALVCFLAGSVAGVVGVAALITDRRRPLTPSLALLVPAWVLVLLALHLQAPDPPPIDVVGVAPTPAPPLVDRLLSGLGGQTVAAAVLAVAGVAWRRDQLAWLAGALLVAGALAVLADPDHLLGALGLVAVAGSLPFAAGWARAAPAG